MVRDNLLMSSVPIRQRLSGEKQKDCIFSAKADS